MPRRKRAPATRPSAYDSLIDAERAALIQAGRKANRGELIKALADAADLSPKEARRAVAGYIDRRGGSIPSGSSLDDARTGWIDDLLDAERLSAARDDRPVTPRTLLRAVRLASASLTPREAQAAVADYLHRRGGRTPSAGRWRLVVLGTLGLIVAALTAWRLLRSPP